MRYSYGRRATVELCAGLASVTLYKCPNIFMFVAVTLFPNPLRGNKILKNLQSVFSLKIPYRDFLYPCIFEHASWNVLVILNGSINKISHNTISSNVTIFHAYAQWY